MQKPLNLDADFATSGRIWVYRGWDLSADLDEFFYHLQLNKKGAISYDGSFNMDS